MKDVINVDGIREKFNKVIYAVLAFVMTLSIVLPQNCFYAEELIEDDTDEEEMDIIDVDFYLSNFDVTSSMQNISLSWNVDCSDNTELYYFNVMVDVYRSTDGTNYTNIATVESYFESDMSYTDLTIEKGIYYYYKIKVTGYYYGSSYSEYHAYSGQDLVYGYNPVALASEDFIPVISISALNDRKLKISWDKTYPEYATITAYQIYRSANESGPYTLVKTIKDEAGKYNYSFVDKNLTLGDRWCYKLKVAYTDYYGESYVSEFSNMVSRLVTINKPEITEITSTRARTISVSWNKQVEAEGYYVYYKKGASGTYKKIKTIKDNSKNTYKVTKKKLTNGKKYFIRVVAYKNYNGNELRSASSKGKYCNYYAYKNENEVQRYKRIFGKKTYKRYKSNLAALKHMKSITITVWDKTGKKYYKRKFTLLVHRNIAPTVKQIFREALKLKGSYRIPIHDIGGYSWRGAGSASEHNQGLAIDINANENYMIRNGVVQAGSFWNPKKSKYSIPMKCKFVKILNKYGFERCIWNYSKTEYTRDYMHFSYNYGR